MTPLSMTWMTILLLAIAAVQDAHCQISLIVVSGTVDETETITSQMEMTTASLDYSGATVSSSMAVAVSSVYVTSAGATIASNPASTTATVIAATTTQTVQPSSSTTATAPTTQPATGTPAWGQWTAWVYEACSTVCGNGTRIGFRKRCQISSSSGAAAGTSFCDTVQSLPTICIGTSCPTLGNDSKQGQLYSIPLIAVLTILSALQYWL